MGLNLPVPKLGAGSCLHWLPAPSQRWSAPVHGHCVVMIIITSRESNVHICSRNFATFGIFSSEYIFGALSLISQHYNIGIVWYFSCWEHPLFCVHFMMFMHHFKLVVLTCRWTRCRILMSVSKSPLPRALVLLSESFGWRFYLLLEHIACFGWGSIGYGQIYDLLHDPS